MKQLNKKNVLQPLHRKKFWEANQPTHGDVKPSTLAAAQPAIFVTPSLRSFDHLKKHGENQWMDGRIER